MTQWIKYIKFYAIFIASSLLFDYVKCETTERLRSNIHIENSYNSNNWELKNVESSTRPTTVKNRPSSLKSGTEESFHSGFDRSSTEYANYPESSYNKNLQQSNSDENINSYLQQKSDIEKKKLGLLDEKLSKTLKRDIEKNIYMKLDHSSDQTKFIDISDKSNNDIEVLNHRESNAVVEKYMKSKDEVENIQSENRLSNQENDSNTNNDEFDSQDIEDYDYVVVEENIESDYTGPRLPDCSDKIVERDPVLIVSTIDGHITGINYQSGEVLWSHNTNSEGDPMLSSTMSKLEVSSRGEWIRLIPSLDGGIYRFDGEHVEALPVTADTFLHSSFKFSEDTIFSGGKFLEILGIHPYTGEIKYTCDKSGCPNNPSAGDNKPTLVVRRISYTVRAIDPSVGMERWNFSVGQHEVNIATGDCESLFRGIEEDALPFLHFILPEGNIIAMNKNSEVLWQQKLPSPILSAWSLINDELESVNLFSSSFIPALVPEDRTDDSVDGKREPALYVGIHRGQLYVQENRNLKQEFSSVVQRYVNPNAIGQGFPKVQWQPYLATADSRTPVIHHGAKNHPLLLDYDRKQQTNELIVKHNYDYPFDNGYYLFGDDFDLLNESDSWKTTTESPDEIPYISESFAHHIYYHIIGGGISYFGLVSAMFILLIIQVFLVKRIIANAIRNAQRRINAAVLIMVAYILHNILRENVQILLIIQRLGLNIVPLPPAPPPPPPAVNALPLEAREEEQPPEARVEEQPFVEAQRQDSNFSSRYTSDFEPISRLGKGGFGVVFHVKNKLDENEYAVKRIVLPSKEKSAERVKREIRALAKLNHSNIVRYYNSWLESPPIGWEEEADSWWKRRETLSQSMEEEYTEQTFSEATGQAMLPIQPPLGLKQEVSLSAVVSKLNYNSELLIQTVKSTENEEPSLCDDSKSISEEKNNKDLANNYGDSSGGIVFEGTSDGVVVDDSVDIVFEDTAGSQMEEDVEPSTDKETNESDLDKVTENNDSKLTCKTRASSHSNNVIANGGRESSHSDSILANRSRESFPRDPICASTPAEAKKTSRYKRKKCLSLSSPPNDRRANRRRLNTHTGILDQKRRPSSLPLSTSIVNDDGEVKSSENQPSSPNSRTYLYIQMELCQRESLKEWLSSNKIRDTESLYSLFNDIVHAVEYVHDRSLMHRDLKPSNIFFSLDGKIKIGDFGLVTTIDDESDAITPMVDKSTQPENILGQKHKTNTRNVGTSLYMSPEQNSNESYTYKVDIFSLGLIFFEMLVPFSTDMERYEVMQQAREKVFPSGFHETYPNVENLLQLTLHRNPNERPTTRGIRARQPVCSFQNDLDSISPDEHFSLSRPKGHNRSSSGSFSLLHSSSTSTMS